MSYGASGGGEPGVVANVPVEENFVPSLEEGEEGKVVPSV
jgi:hypothetical protein